MVFGTIISLPIDKQEAISELSDILFNISEIDSTFKYKCKQYKDKVSFVIYSDNKDQAYKRGMLIRNYMENRGYEVFFKVEEFR